MSPTLGWNRYGKSRVRMAKVIRTADRHDLTEITADISLQGDFVAAHTGGDNSSVLPTDTMKNTVYALGRAHPVDPIESFATRLARHFAGGDPVTRARVELLRVPWSRLGAGEGAGHPRAFVHPGPERQACVAEAAGDKLTVGSGLRDLVLLKTSDSAFSGFLRDELTTLLDTRDRILATRITADWTYSPGEIDYNACRTSIRAALMETFASHRSESVQHTAYAMGEAALAACAAISCVTLSMPNLHYLLADLSPLGLDNDNQVFIPVDEPHGVIEVSVER